MITKKSLQNLSALMILLAVGRYQSKRKVAEATNTSIDTVNKYISNLEYALGTRLVVNNTKGCRLTRQGMKVAEQVKDVPVIWTEFAISAPVPTCTREMFASVCRCWSVRAGFRLISRSCMIFIPILTSCLSAQLSHRNAGRSAPMSAWLPVRRKRFPIFRCCIRER